MLDWAVRFKIAVGVARGLHYLHRQCPRRIIHRDIKASNILLGEDFEPQVFHIFAVLSVGRLQVFFRRSKHGSIFEEAESRMCFLADF